MAKKKSDLIAENSDNNLNSIKEELKDYIILEIKKEYNEEIERISRRLIKEKNKSLIFKNIFIVFLIGIIGFMLYLMYSDGYFNRLFKENDSTIVNPVENNVEKKEDTKKMSLQELKNEYSYLLDNIYISEESEYLDNYYGGVLSNELKNYLALNLIDFTSLNKEDDYNIINADTLRIKYNKIFNDSYKSESFDYNGNKIRYINKIDSYISTSLLEKKDTNIKRDIIDIKLLDDKVIIETEESLVKDNVIYNILTGEKIEINDLNDYQNRLTHMAYTFVNEDLTALENKDKL